MLQSAKARQKIQPRANLQVTLARCPTEILEAQKLRYRVFAEELGARLPNQEKRLDEDRFDPFCQHLIVRDESAGRIVGTYRILTPEAARRVGTYYSETEFDLTRLQHLRAQLVEIGRACIDERYRGGAVIGLLWSGLARYMCERKYAYLIGCASVSMADGGHFATSLYRTLRQRHLAPREYSVFPLCPLPLDKFNDELQVHTPALIKGYLRAGAWICGKPAWDPDFNAADFPILLPMNRIQDQYARHFLRPAPTATTAE